MRNFLSCSTSSCLRQAWSRQMPCYQTCGDIFAKLIRAKVMYFLNLRNATCRKSLGQSYLPQTHTIFSLISALRSFWAIEIWSWDRIRHIIFLKWTSNSVQFKTFCLTVGKAWEYIWPLRKDSLSSKMRLLRTETENKRSWSRGWIFLGLVHSSLCLNYW